MKRFWMVLYTLLCWIPIIAVAQKKERPYLLYSPAQLEQAKHRIKTDTIVARAWGELKEKADQQLQKKNLNQIDYVALAYLMTGNKCYSDKIKEVLLDVIQANSWGNQEMLAREPQWRSDLGVAHKAYMSAIAYNAIYDDLSSSERKKIANGLNRLGLDPLLGDWLLDPTRIHTLNSMGHNWWTSCVCMGGILALSLQNEIPEAALGALAVYEALPQWFSFAGDVLQQKPKNFDANGGMYESLNYANFGIQEALQFRLAWMNTHPGEKLEEIPQLEKLTEFFAHVCYPRTGILYNINFGDSHKNVTAESSMMLLYAMGIKNKNMLWYINQVQQGQHRDGYFLNKPMGFLFTPDLSQAPSVPKIECSQIFEDFGWATMRNSWEKNATMLAVKSGYTWNHSHADANSFILFHKGVDILKDAGNCWYPNPAYRNYFFQSEAHNVVLFNGKGQPREQQYHGSPQRGYLHHLMDAGDTKYILANGTGPVADQFSRNFRHFLWIDNVIYIIDDLKTHQMGHFQWLWHPGGIAKKQGVDLNITNGDAAIAVRPLYPRLLAKSDFVHDYPEDLYWEIIEAPTEDLKGKETYYSFHLPAETNKVKGITAIILKDSLTQREMPFMERREGKDWIGLRIRNKGKVTDIYINQLADGRLMHMNSWIEADGWTTDAYMLAVTYKEGTQPADANEFVISYGSALRRGDTSYFASLAKLFVIQKQQNNKFDFLIQGQPLVNATFRSLKRPEQITVNGLEKPLVYKNNTVKIKYSAK